MSSGDGVRKSFSPVWVSRSAAGSRASIDAFSARWKKKSRREDSNRSICSRSSTPRTRPSNAAANFEPLAEASGVSYCTRFALFFAGARSSYPGPPGSRPRVPTSAAVAPETEDRTLHSRHRVLGHRGRTASASRPQFGPDPDQLGVHGRHRPRSTPRSGLTPPARSPLHRPRSNRSLECGGAESRDFTRTRRPDRGSHAPRRAGQRPRRIDRSLASRTRIHPRRAALDHRGRNRARRFRAACP